MTEPLRLQELNLGGVGKRKQMKNADYVKSSHTQKR